MSNVNDVVDVTITIEDPVASSASYSNMLLVLPAPKKAKGTIPDALPVRSVKELESYGYTVTESGHQAVELAFMQDPKPDVVYVTARASEEAVDACLNRAATSSGWYGFVLVDCSANADIQLAAKWADTNGKLFGYSYTTDELLIDLTSYENTFVLYAGSTGLAAEPEANKYAAVAYMATCFGYEPGAETWALKTLKGITPSVLTAAKLASLRVKNVNVYQTIANRDVTSEGKVGTGEWIDVVRLRHWLINELQFQVFAYLAKQTKVPYNDAGITGIQNVVEAVLAGAQKTGGIDTDQYDEDGNVTKGYEVVVPRSENISAAEKKSRKLTGITFVARLAGAIHAAVLKGKLVY